MQHYVAIIHKEPDSDYGVSFPDLPGCVSAGKTLDEAVAMATEAVSFHIEGLIEDGEVVPDPSSLETVSALPEAVDAASLVIIPAPEPRGPVKRVQITMDEYVLRQIDKVAGKGERSAFLEAAAKSMLRGRMRHQAKQGSG